MSFRSFGVHVCFLSCFPMICGRAHTPCHGHVLMPDGPHAQKAVSCHCANVTCDVIAPRQQAKLCCKRIVFVCNILSYLENTFLKVLQNVDPIFSRLNHVWGKLLCRASQDDTFHLQEISKMQVEHFIFECHGMWTCMFTFSQRLYP